MSSTTISWTDHSINPIRARHATTGRVGHYCEKLSPGCKHCYSSRMQGRFGMPSFQAQRSDAAIEPFLDASKLTEVLTRKKSTKYFWCDMTDMFGAWVPDAWIDQCFAVMALTPQHIHQVLTKRPKRLQDYLREPGLHNRLELTAEQYNLGQPHPSFGRKRVLPLLPLSHVWLGVSVENQATADERIPWLLKTPAAVRFLSCEPLLEKLRLDRLGPWQEPGFACPREVYPLAGLMAIPDSDWNVGRIDWVIVGGESGPQARPCHVQWIADLVAQCGTAGVAVWVKQLGARPEAPAWIDLPRERTGVSDGHRPGRIRLQDRKGADPLEWPDALRVQQFPQPEVSHG